MTEQSNAPAQFSLCPSCGAAVAQSERRCWLCQWDMADKIIADKVVTNSRVFLTSNGTRIALIAGIAILGIATVGVFAVAPGIGVFIGVVFVISVFAVTKGLRDPGPFPPASGDECEIASAYSPPTTGDATGGFNVVVQVFKVLGIILLVALASIIAFLTFCVICVVVASNM